MKVAISQSLHVDEMRIQPKHYKNTEFSFWWPTHLTQGGTVIISRPQFSSGETNDMNTP